MTPKVLYCFPEAAGQPFQPSNGTEGMVFMDAFCDRCIHEHPDPEQQQPKCNIIMLTMCYSPGEKEYPEEWVYNDEGWPVCAKWKFWNWGKDDDGNWNDPPPIYPDDPNQLCLPFIFEEMGIQVRKLVET